jgi:ligand-binding SRPBCC domain-containing protein
MINITYQSGIFVLQSSLLVKASLDELWNFISVPENLSKITPPEMNFKITFQSALDNNSAYAGQIISYKVSPLPFFRASWVTEITQVQEKKFFIDEQRFGPYSFWHHQHIIAETDEGVEMRDIVSFKLPFGLLGNALGGWFVKKQLRKIFNYRTLKMKEIFPENS